VDSPLSPSAQADARAAQPAARPSGVLPLTVAQRAKLTLNKGR